MMEELHEGLANVVLAVFVPNVVTMAVSSRLPRENLVGVMVSGCKGRAA